MTARQITHIHKDDRLDPTTAILWVGGVDSNGHRWRMEMRQAAYLVRTGQESFFTLENSRYADVEAILGPSGLHYLRTDPDSVGANNLLHLPELDATFQVVGIINRAMHQPNLGFGPAIGLLNSLPSANPDSQPVTGLLSAPPSIKAAGFVPESMRGGLLNWSVTPQS